MTPKFPSGNRCYDSQLHERGKEGGRLEGLAWLFPQGQVRSREEENRRPPLCPAKVDPPAFSLLPVAAERIRGPAPSCFIMMSSCLVWAWRGWSHGQSPSLGSRESWGGSR